MNIYKTKKGYYFKELKNNKIRISKNEYLLLKKKNKKNGFKNKLIKTSTIEVYFYEWYNGNKNCLESENNIKNSQYLNLPIYTKKSHNYITIPDNYNCITSVDYLTQKGGYNKDWFEHYYVTSKYRNETINANLIKLHNKERFLNLLNICKNKLIKQYNIDTYLNKITHSEGFIQKYKLKNNEIVIMMGDIHGSYHTFFRHMVRLERKGILKYHSKTKEPYLKKNHSILFLGDVIDRGKHGAEVILFILLLIKNSKIYLNRGNHEHKHAYNRYGFQEECQIKEIYDEKILENFFSVCPTAVILINKSNEKVFCCHGCVDINLDLNNFLKSKSLTLPINYEHTKNIMWSDVNVHNLEHKISVRGDDIKLLPLTLIHSYLNKNGISLLFRGHQDSNANTVLAAKMNNIENKYLFENGINLQAFLKSKDKLSNYKNNILEGSLAKVNCNGNMYTYINSKLKKLKCKVRVFTISTNNDLGRPDFFNDSFVILKN